MNIKYVLSNSLPPLAWLSVLDSASNSLVVTHGRNVEVNDNYFVEGVWNGCFSEGNFHDTDCFFGTGCKIFDNELIFVSSASTTDFLYYFNDNNKFSISNSMPLLLAHKNDRLDPDYKQYHLINKSITYGIYGYHSRIPTLNNHIERIMYFNIRVSQAGIRLLEKSIPPAFTNFDEYRSYLYHNYRLIYENIKDSSRNYEIDILSTQSRGYDTTAINAIASKFHIDNTFTVGQSKAIGQWVTTDSKYQGNDDGTDICGKINIHCTKISRKSYENGFPNEHLFYCSMHRADDANMIGLLNLISKTSVLLTGVLGEIWSPKQKQLEFGKDFVDSTLKRGDIGLHGLAEIRLHYGFIQFPLPYIGARRQIELTKITDAPEMSSWRLNNDYDRPIPRRIAEEAGIPREMFGQVKMASLVEFPDPPIPFSNELKNEYFEYLISRKLLNKTQLKLLPIIYKINTFIHFSSPRRYRLIYFMERLISKILRKRFKFTPLLINLNGSLFCFCVNRQVRKYAKLLS